MSLTGKQLGYISVGEPTGECKIDRSGQKHVYYHCNCSCGNSIIMDSRQISTRARRSCGCRVLATISKDDPFESVKWTYEVKR